MLRRYQGLAVRNPIAYAIGFLILVVVVGLAITSLLSVKDERTNPAPDFDLEVFANENHAKGEVVSLSQFKGRPVVLNFWYPSCAPCALEMPDLEATFKNHKADGLQFIGVMFLGLDTPEAGQEFIDETGITYAIGPDSGDIVLDYVVIGFPTTVFLNEKHEIVRSWVGLLTAEKIEELLKEHALVQ